MDPGTIATTATAFLKPYIVKAGEKVAEEVGAKLPEAVTKVWNAIKAKFRGKVASEKAVKDFVANPEEQDNIADFRKRLKELLEADPNFANELADLLKSAQAEAGDTIIVTGPGAAATRRGVAAGKGGVAVGGDVHGNIKIGKTKNDN